MTQQALPDRVPVREARLGRPRGGDRAVCGVVLLLPGGTAHSVRRPSARATAAMLPLARRFARTGREADLAVHVVRYRYRGWNGAEAHTAGDAEWAVDEVVRRYGDVPVCLAGTDVGARAALRAAGHPAVASVLALAPWLPDGREEEPVRQLAGRNVLMVHGTDDAHSHPETSFRLAARAKKVNADVCRFEVHTDGHALFQHRQEVAALAEDFVLGTLCERDFCRPLTDAMAAPPPLGLRMPLATGFGRSLRR
ncbi:alpha/beta hydrolase [Streptomyces sp. RKND-216]|uniref:alpha/beta hydrolase n=1 Tax=Streptomyces sp. RKND-216 TaxID=2562581 RepID=UPI00109E0A7D|nr:alpha/beta hydrolase [Streptomyces sp. RKND-216]THA24832.1 alpha/beta hydrolase [Streptomyces sp. RKND-216]